MCENCDRLKTLYPLAKAIDKGQQSSYMIAENDAALLLLDALSRAIQEGEKALKESYRQAELLQSMNALPPESAAKLVENQRMLEFKLFKQSELNKEIVSQLTLNAKQVPVFPKAKA